MWLRLVPLLDSKPDSSRGDVADRSGPEVWAAFVLTSEVASRKVLQACCRQEKCHGCDAQDDCSLGPTADPSTSPSTRFTRSGSGRDDNYSYPTTKGNLRDGLAGGGHLLDLLAVVSFDAVG